MSEEVFVVREIEGIGRLTFEEYPAGSLKKDGTARSKDYRAYKLNGKRLPSVTTLLGAVLPAPGLIRWAETMGAKGAWELAQAGKLPASADEVMQAIRSEEVGADAAKDRGATRGISVHDLLRIYLETGAPPNPVDHPEEHRPYIQGFVKWILARDPEPVADSIEQIVVHPELGYAGRMDVRAIIKEPLCSQDLVIDAKTQLSGGIYVKGVAQAHFYRMADERCGAPPADGTMVVVFDGSGSYHELPGVATNETVEAMVRLYELLKPLNSSVDAHYKAVRAA